MSFHEAEKDERENENEEKDFFIVDNKKVRTACLDLILEAFGRNQENFVATSDVNTTWMAALYPDEIEVISIS